jgi:hypothetical protein
MRPSAILACPSALSLRRVPPRTTSLPSRSGCCAQAGRLQPSVGDSAESVSVKTAPIAAESSLEPRTPTVR